MWEGGAGAHGEAQGGMRGHDRVDGRERKAGKPIPSLRARRHSRGGTRLPAPAGPPLAGPRPRAAPRTRACCAHGSRPPATRSSASSSEARRPSADGSHSSSMSGGSTWWQGRRTRAGGGRAATGLLSGGRVRRPAAATRRNRAPARTPPPSSGGVRAQARPGRRRPAGGARPLRPRAHRRRGAHLGDAAGARGHHEQARTGGLHDGHAEGLREGGVDEDLGVCVGVGGGGLRQGPMLLI
jgi:hypothetical protein